MSNERLEEKWTYDLQKQREDLANNEAYKLIERFRQHPEELQELAPDDLFMEYHCEIIKLLFEVDKPAVVRIYEMVSKYRFLSERVATPMAEKIIEEKFDEQ